MIIQSVSDNCIHTMQFTQFINTFISGIYCTNSNSFENISWLKCYCLISEFHTEFRADVKVSLRQSLCWETQSKLVITFRQNVPNISFPSSGFSEWLSLWLVGLWQEVVLLGGGFWLIIRPKIQERMDLVSWEHSGDLIYKEIGNTPHTEIDAHCTHKLVGILDFYLHIWFG